ncbi:hypothetical protein [Acinetobacter populi]|uniref:Uncharacterized protein n=1 Tax=Acinetobacter populi TaxID=1582270 RepID=A0A1Z9Z1Q7_9GAMM|nr:hypothetical protein [Acinetobacter populi]OUY08385.1 hypothetical protein CAP51_01830 [Acinetobacter populi]
MAIRFVKIPVNQDTYQKLQQITQALNRGEKTPLAKPLGEVFTELTCEVLDQAFGALAKSQENTDDVQAQETAKVLGQIDTHLQKYMPWSISLFSNIRLQPVANYILDQFDCDDPQQIYLQYALSPTLASRVQQNYERLMQNDSLAVVPVFDDLIEVIDTGVTAHIRTPKTILKFNYVVDKTLTRIINLVTNLGYKRIEKVARHLSLSQAQQYARHFNGFIQ